MIYVSLNAEYKKILGDAYLKRLQIVASFFGFIGTFSFNAKK